MNKLNRWANRVLLFLNVLVIVVALLYFGEQHLFPLRSGIEYKDLISIILTAIAVLLAAVTIFVAIIAVWGYTTLREESRKAAEAEAGRIAKQVAADVARVVAARESVVMQDTLKGDGQTGADNELAAALQSGDANGNA